MSVRSCDPRIKVNKLTNRILCLLLFVSICPLMSAYAMPTLPLFSSDQPLEISAASYEVLHNENKVIYSGGVTASQGDMTLTARRLAVTFIDESAVEWLEAREQVHFTQPDRIATADVMTYRSEQGVLILTGSATLKQGPNEVSGDEISYFIDEGRTLVKGGATGRARTLIIPQKKEDSE